MSDGGATKTEEVFTGRVKWSRASSTDGRSAGYGFIQPDDAGSNDAFVHISVVEQAFLTTLHADQRVKYTMTEDKRTGRPRVGTLQLI